MRKREVLKMVAAGFALPGTVLAQSSNDASVDLALRSLLSGDPGSFEAGQALLMAHASPEIAASLIEIMRFVPQYRGQLYALLVAATGEQGPKTWFEWMLWQEPHPEVKPGPHYVAFKRDLLLSIDPNFDVFLQVQLLQSERMKIRLEEIAWGGVAKDGIPSLDKPVMIGAAEAEYLREDDLVFGVEINGDIRAYPLRIMGWHEMFNDVIGGVPVALAYCTLCGSGILFETDVEGQGETFVFGSSGFLYRSNKLMFDRQTHSLWNQFTGEPVVGPLVDAGIVLEQRPVTIEPWGKWSARNPGTTVLALDTGFKRDYGSGVVYSRYFGSDDLMFPVVVNEAVLRQKDYVFGIRQFGGAKAWPLTAFEGGRVINDALLGTDLVLIGDADGRSVRAYERRGHVFEAASDGLQEGDAVWQIAEDALRGPDGETLPRVAGHVAYWFAWDGYMGGQAELFGE